jgi:sugar transferase (PEP-CTERM/EpsH1 system associated)
MRAESTLDDHAVAPAGKAAGVPLIAHVIYRLDVGGLENGLVNLINRIPADRFRHVIICLTHYTEFRSRLQRSDVEVYALNKPQGHSPLTHFKLWRLLRKLRPDIVHTRNLASLEGALPAALAGVRSCIHGEHGRDVNDLDGSNRKYQIWRRVFKPFVDHYIAVSRDLEAYLKQKVAVPAARVTQIYNGVDAEKFRPARGQRELLPCTGFCGPEHFVIGTVGRMQDVKDQLTLARAFALLMQRVPHAAQRLRLVMIGEGPLRERVQAVLADAGVAQYAWLPGERDDVAGIMRGLDLFVLPSLAEGISNTILEAMATGLPIVATAVGGNGELLDAGVTGKLVPPADAQTMAQAISIYVEDPELCRRHGAAARHAVERRFSMEAMMHAYMAVYDQVLAGRRQLLRV